jgi:hypothetical protein
MELPTGTAGMRRAVMVQFVGRPGLAFVALIACLSIAGEASAESIQKQCSSKYQAAKAANSLNGQNWNQFYKQCAAELKGAPASSAPAAAPAAAPAPTEATTPEKPRKKKEETSAPAAAPVPTGPVVFPTAVSSKYSSETPAKQRFHTCLDQYHANKASNSNGGLKWIEKGDGYYSECNKKLKGG